MHTPKVKYKNIAKKSPEIHGMIKRKKDSRIRVPEDMALSKQDEKTFRKKKGIKGISKATKNK